MISASDAMIDSRINPGIVVPFQMTSKLFNPDQIKSSGAFLNGGRHGEFIWYFDTGAIECHCFFKNGESYGEYVYYAINGCVLEHSFRSTNGTRIDELVYLFDEPRDEAFYFTLALHGIDKEYTIG